MPSSVKYILVLGPDGCGKTTVADELANLVEAAGHSALRLDFSFGIMPSISRVLGRAERKAASEGQLNSGMVEPLPASRAAILAIWYGIDHVMGHWKLRFGKSDDLFIFARSYHDFLYQRAYLRLPPIIPLLFLILGPKPDLLLVPFRCPKAIHQQKPELTVQEISDQYDRIEGKMARYRNFQMIDASGGVTQTVLRCRNLLSENLSGQKIRRKE